MASIEQYKQANGYYNTTKIREDAGMNSRAALFADIFGGDDSDGGQPTAKLAPAWQALLDEAERRNNEIESATRMDAGEFADWAVERFGVDYDNVMFWDMLRDLSGNKRMPEGFEVDTSGDIPAHLYDLLMARKATHTPSPRTEDEARTLVQQPEPWSRETWKRLVELRYAVRYTEDGGEQGYMTTSYTLTERGERLLDPSYRAPGLYNDQGGIDG